MNIIEKISAAMFEDTDNLETQSALLIDIYEQSTCKQDIDNILICLCGYSMDSLYRN